jgi:ankyrin repeat protein
MLPLVEGNTDILDYLFEAGVRVNNIRTLIATPLHYAVSSGNVDLIEYLNTKTPGIDLKDYKGFAPIQIAILNKDIRMVGKLIEHGAYCNAKDLKGRTVYQLAKFVGNQEIVEILENVEGIDKSDISIFSRIFIQLQYPLLGIGEYIKPYICQGEALSEKDLLVDTEGNKAIVADAAKQLYGFMSGGFCTWTPNEDYGDFIIAAGDKATIGGNEDCKSKKIISVIKNHGAENIYICIDLDAQNFLGGLYTYIGINLDTQVFLGTLKDEFVTPALQPIYEIFSFLASYVPVLLTTTIAAKSFHAIEKGSMESLSVLKKSILNQTGKPWHFYYGIKTALDLKDIICVGMDIGKGVFKVYTIENTKEDIKLETVFNLLGDLKGHNAYVVESPAKCRTEDVTVYNFGGKLEGYQVCEIKEQTSAEWLKSFLSMDYIDSAITWTIPVVAVTSSLSALREGWYTDGRNTIAKYTAFGKAAALSTIAYLSCPAKLSEKDKHKDESISFILANNKLQSLKDELTEKEQYEKKLYLVKYPGECNSVFVEQEEKIDKEVYLSLLGEWKICEFMFENLDFL